MRRFVQLADGSLAYDGPNAAISGAVAELKSMQSQVQAEAPELSNLYTNLVQKGQGLAAGSPTSQDAQDYAAAIRNFATVLNAPDDTLTLDLINAAEGIVNTVNNLNPLAPLVPGNPNSPIPPLSTWSWSAVMPWLIGGAVFVGAIIILPHVIDAMERRQNAR